MSNGRDLAEAHRQAGQPRNTASLYARAGSASIRMRVRVTPRGLMALTGLVTCTLLSAAAIVAVATRKLPEGAMPARMKRSRW